MGFPFNRTAHAKGWVGAAQLLGHVLATGFGLMVYLGLHHFDLQYAWDEDLAGKRVFAESLLDLVLANCIRTAVFVFLWTFTVGWHVSVLVVVAACGHLIAKCVVAQAMLMQGFGLAVALLTLLSILFDVAALCSFRFSNSDPDVELLQRTGSRTAEARQPPIEMGTVLLQEGSGAAGPGADQAVLHGKASVLRTLLRFTSPDVGLLAVGTVLMLLSMGSQLLLPGFTGRCLSAAISGEEGRASFNENLFGLVLTSVMLAFFTGTRIWNTAKLEVRLICRVQRILFACILERDVSYFDTVGTGQLTSRISSDAQMLAQIMTTNINLVLQKGIVLIGALAFMFTLNVRLAGAYILVSLSFFAFTRWFGQLTKRLQKGIQSVRADANQVAMQALSGIRTVRACTAEPFEREHYDAESRRLVQEELRLKMCWTCYAPLVSTITNVLTIVVLVLGGHYVSTGELRAGDMAAFLFYSQMVQDAMNTVANQIVAVFQGLGAGEKIFEIIAAPPPKVPLEGGYVPSDEELAAIPIKTPLLEFRAVSFCFPGKDSKALRGLALAVHFEESIGIVGPSGSGKSTLLSLALRFFDPSGGAVFFAGWDARVLDPLWLRRQIACVPQDPMLFDTSVRKNVAYAMPEATEDEIENALRRAEAKDFVEALPQGLESRVGERGVTLSGGQRQRLALARALLLRPRLLAFDEATSALDTATEARVNENVLALHDDQRKAGHGFAMMVIAHRLSTVRELDAIWVVQDGAAKETGTHQALLAKRGAYYELVQKQLLADGAASDDVATA